jgi:hypothetical protein
MFNLKDLSVKAKIILSVGVFQILSLIIAILGTMGLSRMEKELSIVSDIFVNIEGNLNDLKFGVDNRRLNLVRAVNADNKADFEREMNQVKAIQKGILGGYSQRFGNSYRTTLLSLTECKEKI